MRGSWFSLTQPARFFAEIAFMIPVGVVNLADVAGPFSADVFSDSVKKSIVFCLGVFAPACADDYDDYDPAFVADVLAMFSLYFAVLGRSLIMVVYVVWLFADFLRLFLLGCPGATTDHRGFVEGVADLLFLGWASR